MSVNEDRLADQLGHGRRMALAAEDFVVTANFHLHGYERYVLVSKKVNCLDETSLGLGDVRRFLKCLVGLLALFLVVLSVCNLAIRILGERRLSVLFYKRVRVLKERERTQYMASSRLQPHRFIDSTFVPTFPQDLR